MPRRVRADGAGQARRASVVPREMLLCFPDPLMPAKGFSCIKHARPWRAETSSAICMNIRFWSICVVAVPKKGAFSYWLGATSRCLVRMGIPIMKHSC